METKGGSGPRSRQDPVVLAGQIPLQAPQALPPALAR